MTAKIFQLPGKTFESSEFGNADLFKHMHQDHARFVVGIGWLLYDGLRWQPDTSNQVLTLAMQAVKKITDLEWRQKSKNNSKLNSMIRLAQPKMTTDGDQLDCDPWLLNCLNGTVDLRTGQLSDHDPKQFITKLVPFEFDPDAKAPQWNQFLEQVLPNDDLRAYIQRAVGYSLTGRTDEQVLFFCLGKGRNGKSIFLEALQEMLADYACNTPTSTFLKTGGGIPNDIARLRGSRFVTLSETGQDQKFDEPKLKDMTGGHTVSGRFLFKEFFDFKMAGKLWLRGNHQPVITGLDDGIWRRFHVVPFDVQISEAEVDKKLPDKLREELPGILTWAVQGAMLWNDDDVKAPEIVTEAVQQYRKDSDVIGRFVEAHCIEGPDYKVGATTLYQSYREFAKQNGERVVSQTEFGRSLSNRGFTKYKSNGKYVYQGLGLKQGQ